MNLLPCRLEESAAGLRVRLNSELAFPVPDSRRERYRAHLDKSHLLFGLRPEHIVNQRPHLESAQHPFEAALEVTESMGMDTLVHFQVNGNQVCGRVGPNAGAQAGARMKLVADLENMHLIDDETGKVL